MTHVLLVVRPAAGGIRSHVLSLIKWANRERVTFAVAAPPDFRASVPDGVLFHPLNIAPRLSPSADVRAAHRLVSVAKDFDVVHAHGLRAGFVCALSGVPFVLTAHNLVERSVLTRFALRLIASRAVRILAVSHAVSDTLTANSVPPSKVTVLPNGVDVEGFLPPAGTHLLASQVPPETGGLGGPPAPNNGGARPVPVLAQMGEAISPVPPLSGVRGPLTSLNLGAEGSSVLTIARLSPEKGVDVLLDAARLCPDVPFTVAGDGPLRETLTRAAPPNVTFAGRVPDTRPLLWASTVVVIPSRSEGQGIVALEAMAAGVPVIATRVGGLPEMVTDTVTGLLVPPNDPAALASALRRLLSDRALQERLIGNASRLVRTHYDIRTTVAAVVDVYVSFPETA